MKIFRKCKEISACGLNCGLCPHYYTDGTSKCLGCGASDNIFCSKCKIIECNQEKNIEYCYECDNYPCKRFKSALHDSFITHQNIFTNFIKIKECGLIKYQEELKEKMNILNQLLNNYNDGRRKAYYCLAINLLELDDTKEIYKQIKENNMKDLNMKDKAIYVVSLLNDMSKKRNITIKLNKYK